MVWRCRARKYSLRYARYTGKGTLNLKSRDPVDPARWFSGIRHWHPEGAVWLNVSRKLHLLAQLLFGGLPKYVDNGDAEAQTIAQQFSKDALRTDAAPYAFLLSMSIDYRLLLRQRPCRKRD